MIIDDSYFTGKINLPQTGNTDGLTLVNAFITTYEPEYLKKVMCYDLWKVFEEGTDGSGEEQRFIDIIEGKEFEHNGNNHKWEGFEGVNSPIARYVYYQFLADDAQNTSLVGQITPKTSNAIRANPVPKMVDAWNVMVDQNWMLRNFIKANADTYPEYTNCHECELFVKKNSFDL